MKTIIVADYNIWGKIEECMVSAYGTPEVLERMINNPTKADLEKIGKGKNLRLCTLEDKDCWWNAYGTN